MDNGTSMTHARSDYRFLERLRVRWAEVDMQRIVFNGHYLTYFDTAVAGYWRALAIPYQETMAHLGGDFYVRKATVEYTAPAHYDDLIDVGVRTQRTGNSSLGLTCAAFRGEQLLVSAELVYVFADPTQMASKPIPPELRELVQLFEAGKPMVNVKIGRWSELNEGARKIRSQVFIDEQHIAAEMEWDGADDGCVHALALNHFGFPLATGRLLEHVPGVAKIGRMAVLAPMRSGRIGSAVLEALLQHARERGDREALLHAQLSAVPFYTRAGFTARGAVFEDAGIPHIEMVRVL